MLQHRILDTEQRERIGEGSEVGAVGVIQPQIPQLRTVFALIQ
jgi:hypothetical protein